VTNSGSRIWIGIVLLDEIIGSLPVRLSLFVLRFGRVVLAVLGDVIHELVVILAQSLILKLV